MAKGASLQKRVKPGKPLRVSASVLRVRWDELLGWSQAVHQADKIAELHNMRIAAKRLRYTLEIFAPVLGEEAKTVLQVVEQIQERIGAIHDCDVQFPLLTETLEKEMRREERRNHVSREVGPPPYLAAEGLAALIARKRTEREARYADFLNYWETLPPSRIGDLLETVIAAAEQTKDTKAKDKPDAA